MTGKEVTGRIDRFLGLYNKPNTRGGYKSAIYNFLDFVYDVQVRKKKFRVAPEEKQKYEELAEQYFTEERDHFEDVLRFIVSLHGRPPTGVKSTVNAVREFLKYNDVEFTERQRKQLSTKLPKAKNSRTAEKDVDVEILRKIIAHMDLKAKTVTLVLASSGMRIGEALQITLSDIDLTTEPAQVVVRGEYTKSGDTRTTFVSTEAKELLHEWLKVRKRYLVSAQNKAKGLLGKEGVKSVTDDRLFPFSSVNFREGWENALRKAELWNKDNSTGRSQIRVHGLRKFFRSQLALSCPLDIVEALMGHEGYLTDAYRRYSQKQLGEYYLKAEHHVTVTGSGDLREIQDTVQDQQAAIEGYRGILCKQAEETAELKRDFVTMKEELAAMVSKEKERAAYDARMTILVEHLAQDPEISELIQKKIEAIHKDKL